jgi:dipeptidyl aminopeptidase/acylaminoacyl peptidase
MLRTLLAAGLIFALAPANASATTASPAASAAPPPATAAAPRGFEVRDLVALDRVSDPQVSPDGKQIAFQLRETDIENNRGLNSLWLAPADGSAPARRLTAKGASSSVPRWSHDGRALYFVSARGGGTAQLWRMPIDGGEPVQATRFALPVGTFALSPDGRRLAVAFDVFVDCAADLSCTKKKLDERAASKQTGQHYDQLFVRHWDTWKNGTRSQLFVAQLDADGIAGEELTWISRGIAGDVPSKPFGADSEWAFSPDGGRIVFAARTADRSEAWSTNLDLFIAPVDGSREPENLTSANQATDTAPVFSPDGRTLFHLAMKRPKFEADREWIIARDLESGSVREIATDWDRSPGGLLVSRDGRKLYAIAQSMGQRPLFEIEVGTGKVRDLTGDGNVIGAGVAGDTIAFVEDSLAGPAQLFTLGARGGKPRQLTDFNRERLAHVGLGEFEQFSFAGAGGATVRGYIVKPWNLAPGQRVPVAFLVHGGPQSSMANAWHYRWNAQTYAGAGFATIMIDFHGSTGYGQAFTDAISGDWGGKPLEDLKLGMAAAATKYPFIDADRACALGGSYGGYMISWIAGNWPDGFRCLVNHAGVFDTRAMGYMTEELWFTEWEFGGTVFDDPTLYEKWNPANHVSEWRTPMLVIHGELDFRVPYTQGIAAFTAAQRRGIPSEYLHFADENHWILKPHNSIQWHDAVKTWLKRWTAPAAVTQSP